MGKICNCRERTRNKMVEKQLYPGMVDVEFLDVDMLSGRSGSPAQATFPPNPDRKKGQKKPKGFSVFHRFCPFCGVTQEADPAWKAFDTALVRVPKETLKTMAERVEVYLVETDRIVPEAWHTSKVIFDCYEQDEDGPDTFVFGALNGEGCVGYEIKDYDKNYFVLMERGKYLEQIRERRSSNE